MKLQVIPHSTQFISDLWHDSCGFDSNFLLKVDGYHDLWAIIKKNLIRDERLKKCPSSFEASFHTGNEAD